MPPKVIIYLVHLLSANKKKANLLRGRLVFVVSTKKESLLDSPKIYLK